MVQFGIELGASSHPASGPAAERRYVRQRGGKLVSKTKRCPSCRRSLLQEIEAHGSLVHVCVRCGGLWFEAGDLSRAIRSHDPTAIPPEPLASSVGEKLTVSSDQCRTCEEQLGVYNLSTANALRIEVCQNCSGVWLPSGNLDRALAGHQLSHAQQAIDSDRTRAHWFLQFLTGLPTEFNITPRKTPVVTYGLILVNALIHFAAPFAYLLGTISAFFLALDPEEIGKLHWVASLFTSQFLHVTTIHLLGNMYFLWILGDNIEDVLGGAAYLTFYLAAGVAAGIFCSVTVDPAASLAGASGAISGLLALYAVLFRRSKLTFMLVFWQFKLAAPFYVGIWVAFNLAGWALEVPGIGWEAHIGGFAFGLIVGLAFHRRLLARRPLLRLLNDGSSHAA